LPKLELPYVLLEVAMRLTHKTTVMLSEPLHRQLSQLAAERGQSMGELVRQACERQYGMADVEARLAAVEALRAMRLPVGPVEQMIAESVPAPRDLPD
jgi:predicted DNA-binding protein